MRRLRIEAVASKSHRRKPRQDVYIAQPTPDVHGDIRRVHRLPLALSCLEPTDVIVFDQGASAPQMARTCP